MVAIDFAAFYELQRESPWVAPGRIAGIFGLCGLHEAPRSAICLAVHTDPWDPWEVRGVSEWKVMRPMDLHDLHGAKYPYTESVYEGRCLRSRA